MVLTARDEKKGIDALEKFKSTPAGTTDNLFFHQLDVANSSSVASLAEFVKIQFGRLDSLVSRKNFTGSCCIFLVS